MWAAQCIKQTKGATQSQVCSTGGRGAQRGRSAPTAGAVLPSFAPVGGVGGKMVDHLGVCQLQRSREAVSPSVAENGIVGLAASVHLSVCLAEPADEIFGFLELASGAAL